MTTIHNRVRHGRIEADAPADWPDGTPVEILPLAADAGLGMREDDWPTTPEGLADLLRRWDTHEPSVLTPDEEADLADWAAWLPTVEPPVLTPDEIAEAARFEE